MADSHRELQGGTGHQKEQGMVTGLRLSAPCPTSGEGEGLKVELIANDQGFNQSCLCHEASIVPPMDGADELPDN